MNTLKIPQNKIYFRLLIKINNEDVFPNDYISPRNILYTRTKDDTKKEFGIVKIEDTVHFKYVINKNKNIDIYKKYLKLASQNEHDENKFDELIQNFDLDCVNRNKVILKKINFRKRNYYEVLDGCHRLSVFFNQYEYINSNYFQLVNDN